MNLRLPNITATTDAARLQQVQSYLFQLVGELNYTLGAIEAGGGSGEAQAAALSALQTGGTSSSGSATATFESIKGLIIKSADIVNAYYEIISDKLEGQYVAESDFGTYVEKTSQEIERNSSGIEQLYKNLQEIVTDIEGVGSSVIGVNAHINSGLLYYDENGAPVYGLEIGQRTEIDGVEVFDKYARFTSEKLSFFDNNGTEVAYISDRQLYITRVHVRSSFAMGGLVDTVQPDNTVVTRWVDAEVE